MLHTGIDKHKDNSYLTTVNDQGSVIKQDRIKNLPALFIEYFRPLRNEPRRVVVESTTGWYWLDDLFASMGIELILAHAKYLKAIAYAKVKTDKIDSETLAQLLRMNYIPCAHKINRQQRDVRDLTRARLRLVWKRTACYNSIHRMGEKFNCDHLLHSQEKTIPDELPQLYREQLTFINEQIAMFDEQITHIEHLLQDRLLDNDDIQRLLWVPAFGRITAFSVYVEIDGIERFESDKKFISYARVVPGANNSNRSYHHKSGSKDGNKYLKIALTDAAVHAARYYPEIRVFYRKIVRRSNEAIARTVVAKELARIVYYILKNKEPYKGFKGQTIQRQKKTSWPRRAAFAPALAATQI